MFTRKKAKPKAEWVRVAAVEEVPPERLRAVQTDGGPIVLANVDGHIYALEDRCSHQDYPLSAGEVEDGQIECSFHGARFDVCTGRATQLPAITPVRTFEVEVRDDSVYVLLD